MPHADDESALALATEQQIYDVVEPLGDSDRIGRAKVLLARGLSPPIVPDRQITLRPIATEESWNRYADERVAVEADFGVTESRARAMVDELRQRAKRVGMTLFFAVAGHDVVGAIGHFKVSVPHGDCVRLQEVDIFPQWRGRGYGTSMLLEMLHHVAIQGCITAVIGADEDDWPLDWYRRHDFFDVLRVRSARH